MLEIIAKEIQIYRRAMLSRSAGLSEIDFIFADRVFSIFFCVFTK